MDRNFGFLRSWISKANEKKNEIVESERKTNKNEVFSKILNTNYREDSLSNNSVANCVVEDVRTETPEISPKQNVIVTNKEGGVKKSTENGANSPVKVKISKKVSVEQIVNTECEVKKTDLKSNQMIAHNKTEELNSSPGLVSVKKDTNNECNSQLEEVVKFEQEKETASSVKPQAAATSKSKKQNFNVISPTESRRSSTSAFDLNSRHNSLTMSSFSSIQEKIQALSRDHSQNELSAKKTVKVKKLNENAFTKAKDVEETKKVKEPIKIPSKIDSSLQSRLMKFGEVSGSKISRKTSADGNKSKVEIETVNNNEDTLVVKSQELPGKIIGEKKTEEFRAIGTSIQNGYIADGMAKPLKTDEVKECINVEGKATSERVVKLSVSDKVKKLTSKTVEKNLIQKPHIELNKKAIVEGNEVEALKIEPITETLTDDNKKKPSTSKTLNEKVVSSESNITSEKLSSIEKEKTNVKSVGTTIQSERKSSNLVENSHRGICDSKFELSKCANKEKVTVLAEKCATVDDYMATEGERKVAITKKKKTLSSESKLRKIDKETEKLKESTVNANSESVTENTQKSMESGNISANDGEKFKSHVKLKSDEDKSKTSNAYKKFSVNKIPCCNESDVKQSTSETLELTEQKVNLNTDKTLKQQKIAENSTVQTSPFEGAQTDKCFLRKESVCEAKNVQQSMEQLTSQANLTRKDDEKVPNSAMYLKDGAEASDFVSHKRVENGTSEALGFKKDGKVVNKLKTKSSPVECYPKSQKLLINIPVNAFEQANLEESKQKSLVSPTKVEAFLRDALNTSEHVTKKKEVSKTMEAVVEEIKTTKTKTSKYEKPEVPQTKYSSKGEVIRGAVSIKSSSKEDKNESLDVLSAITLVPAYRPEASTSYNHNHNKEEIFSDNLTNIPQPSTANVTSDDGEKHFYDDFEKTSIDRDRSMLSPVSDFSDESFDHYVPSIDLSVASSFRDNYSSRTSITGSSTPRRIFPQMFKPFFNHLDKTKEDSPVVFDASMSFDLNSNRTSLRHQFKPNPAFADQQTTSNSLTCRIAEFLNRTDHIMEEWKRLGKGGDDLQSLVSLPANSISGLSNANRKSATNIMIKGLLNYSKGSRSPSVRSRSIARTPEVSDRTISDIDEVGNSVRIVCRMPRTFFLLRFRGLRSKIQTPPYKDASDLKTLI